MGRKHTIDLGLFEDADGREFRAAVTVDEDKIESQVFQAMGRCDGRKRLANDGVIVAVARIAAAARGPDGGGGGAEREAAC